MMSDLDDAEAHPNTETELSKADKSINEILRLLEKEVAF